MTGSIKPTAQVQAFVDALGEDLAVKFLLTYGGAECYIAANPGKSSKLVKLVGMDNALRLYDVSHRIPARIPTARPYLAAVLRSWGLPDAEIARRLHASDVTVRKWLKRWNVPRTPDAGRQMTWSFKP